MNMNYKNYDFSYPELCITKEVIDETYENFMKCYIPVLMPFIPEGEPLDIEVRPTDFHLVNKDMSGIENSGTVESSNYVFVFVPEHLAVFLKGGMFGATCNHEEEEEEECECGCECPDHIKEEECTCDCDKDPCECGCKCPDHAEEVECTCDCEETPCVCGCKCPDHIGDMECTCTCNDEDDEDNDSGSSSSGSGDGSSSSKPDSDEDDEPDGVNDPRDDNEDRNKDRGGGNPGTPLTPNEIDDEFIITFVGGNINHRMLIGRCR